MIYYSIIPKNINHITITHADFINIDKVTCKLIIRSNNGKVVTKMKIQKTYPFLYSKKCNFKEDIYLDISFFQNNELIKKPGTIDILYKTKVGRFGIGLGGLTENCNNIKKETICSTIVKNCCFISDNNNTVIYIINPNTTQSRQTARKGKLKYKLLDDNGRTIYEKILTFLPSELKKIDIKNEIFKGKYFNKKPSFFTFVSENNFNVLPITFMDKNSIPTGCEHSQPKFNYFRGHENGPQNMKMNFFRLLNSVFK